MPPETFKILLVEDNPDDARLVREYLKDAGVFRADLAHVERLTDAQRILETDRFDVVLLDLSLPDSRGLDTIVGAMEHARGVPIVVFTGLDDEELAVRALHEGAQDYLVKGRMDGSSVSRAIRYAIERARREYADALRNSQTRHLWGSLIRTLGPGASAVLYQAGVMAGTDVFDFIHKNWSPSDEREFVQMLREHLRAAGLCTLLEFTIDRPSHGLAAEVKDNFEAVQSERGSDRPICHFLRGLLSGLASRILEVPDLVCDERSCQARGEKACTFRVHPMFASPGPEASS
ncbi:MAG: response regulator [Thermoplasmata archaeon]